MLEVLDDIAQHGGRPIAGKAGHSIIKERRSKKMLLGGEMSGHIFFGIDGSALMIMYMTGGLWRSQPCRGPVEFPLTVSSNPRNARASSRLRR